MRSAALWRWVGLAAAAGVLVAAVDATGVMRNLELPLRDAILRRLPRRAPALAAAVVIDDRALDAFAPWPWPRTLLADLLRGALASGARGAVVDVLLLEPRPGDSELAKVMRSLPTVLVVALDGREGRWLEPPPPLAGAARLAHGIFELDHDGVLRRLLATKQAGGVALPAAPVAAATLAFPTLAIPVGRQLLPAFRVAPDAVPVVAASRLLEGADVPALRGKIVFIGLTATGLGDRVVTPLTRGPAPDPGVLVQAAVAESLAAADLIHPTAPWLAALLAVGLAAAAGAVARLGGVRRLVFDSLLLITPLLAAYLAIRLADVALPGVTLTLLVVAVVIGTELSHGFLAWRRTGTVAALLGAAAGESAGSEPSSLEGRLALVEALATAAARRRVADEEARRVMAHELKTPLTSVRGLGQMLRDLDLSPDERRRAADLLVTEAGRLQALIAHLTELERLPHRRFESSSERLDLAALVRDRAELAGRGHRRTVVVDVADGLIVRGDAELLGRVFDNLLGNAFKYSPADTPVEVRGFSDGAEAVIEIRDHGSGISREEHEAIFRRFVRGASAHEQEGLGIGLAVVREVLTWHGGRVTVDSGPGRGSVFQVVLPAGQKGIGVGQDPRRR